MDCGTSFRIDHAAGGGSAGRQFEIEMGATQAIYDWGRFDRGCLSFGIRLDGRDSADVC